jgi:hypothetical protein
VGGRRGEREQSGRNEPKGLRHFPLSLIWVWGQSY